MGSFFEGWYFRQQTSKETVALIPACHKNPQGHSSASIQVITKDTACFANYGEDAFQSDKRRLFVQVGNSTFSTEGIKLDIETDSVKARGELNFGELTPIRYDIMGPFQFTPLLECRHSIFSMTHSVNGRLIINERTYDFANARGYIEGDRGSSFPKRYAWAHCQWEDETPCSLMLSVADIPFLGKRFTGVIGIVYLNGQEYRLATYLGARVAHIGGGSVTVKQGKYALTVTRMNQRAMLLRAPVRGSMIRLIREHPACRLKVRFEKNHIPLFDFVTDQAGFEYEYNF